MPDNLGISCIILVNSKREHCLNKITDENKIKEMLEKLFEKTNTILEDKMNKIEASINNIKKNDINTVRDDLKNDINN